ncbi:GvpL/GvpF family gas vesicle protein [Planotetraspora kaengkrachanensis]|uniref:Gas vesicle protein n=1 Tax=Planotetraspora kaengkrachanensis TaxID=575193 RepID=A0A8J3VCG7_9ACTN|nr:GvpL/GvpF family gas vesicle protein [Planotetraspora kaengkrachanensis]GIG84792.1 gas vesicle protein [Planotetraspora kaengkrachanensis]
MTESGIYLYAVTSEAGDACLSVRGVLGAPVRKVGAADLAAYVSTVPLDQFGEEPLARLLEDLDWVGEVARAHHRVVEAVAEAGPTAPVRLVTVYSGEEQVRELLERRHDDFLAVLSRVAGRREWGVKAYVDPDAASRTAEGAAGRESSAGREATTGRTGAGPGTAYLQRRKENLHNRQDLWRQAVARAERLHAALGEIAVAGRRHRPQDPQLSGRREWMVLNGAYLVEEDRGAEFAAAVAAFREAASAAGPGEGAGMDVELTGPWAPYSFTAVELETEGGEGGAR